MMAFKQFRKVRLTDDLQLKDIIKAVNTLQDNIQEAIVQLTNKDQLDRLHLDNILLLPNTVNVVPHMLSRTLQGWSVCRNHNGYSIITDVQDTNKSQHLTLLLTTPTRCLVDLEVW
jgi:hypothetical protein